MNKILVKFGNKEFVANTRIRHQSFCRFKDKWFQVSQVYTSKKDLAEKCAKNYHTVLVGSDQLWLPANIAADYYTLSFVPDSVNSVAYATSFGQSVLPSDITKKASVFLRRIKHISVREESGKKLVKELANRDVPVVCDPTLLFDCDQWMEIQDQKPIEKEKYIFCYFLGNNPEQRAFAKRLREETGYQIIALTHLPEYKSCDNGYADKTPFAIDPGQFVNLIRNAQYVCTDSFHCTVFSILYRRDFFTFRRFQKDTKVSTNSRLDTLFHMTGIEHHILTGNEDIKDCITLTIDYDSVHERLKKVRQESLEYLKRALEDGSKTG